MSTRWTVRSPTGHFGQVNKYYFVASLSRIHAKFTGAGDKYLFPNNWYRQGYLFAPAALRTEMAFRAVLWFADQVPFRA